MRLSKKFAGFMAAVMMLAAMPVYVMGIPMEAKAATTFYESGSIELKTGTDATNIWIYTGASGKFTAEFDILGFDVEDSDIITVKNNGNYKAKSEGSTELTVELDNEEESYAKYKLHVVEYPEELGVSPKSRSETKPTQDTGAYPSTQFKITGIDITSNTKIETAVTDGDMTPTISISKNVVTLKSLKGGKCTVTVTVNGVDTSFKWTLNAIRCEPMVLSPGKKQTVSVQNADPSDFKWTSESKSIATISSSGKVTAKKAGNAVIVGKDKEAGYRVGCVVSVVPEDKVKAITRAKEIAEGTYSQPKRMMEGYYDCSSLVWRAYSPYGYNFGVKSGYAPTAAAEASYLDSKGKIYAKWKEKDMKKMRYNAGDLMFRTNTGNGRYKGINHIEMITGYEVVSFDKKGKATVICDWASKNPEYSYSIYEHDIIGKV